MQSRNVIFLFCLLLSISSMELMFAAEFGPQSVWTAAETLPGHEIDKISDGRLDTTVQLLDDTRTGKSDKTQPARGSVPVTAILILDLGEVKTVRGIRLTASESAAPKMARIVSLFSCSDTFGKTNIKELVRRELPAVIYSNSAFVVSESPFQTRYLGVRIEESYERPNNFPVIPRNQWFQQTYRSFQKEFGFETSGWGMNFLTEIAEVACFDTLPSDYRQANSANLAFPEFRLLRDWIYRDFGMKYAQTMQSMSESAKQKYFQRCREKRLSALKELVELAKTNRFIYTKHTVIGAGTMLGGSEYLTDSQYYDPNPDARPGSQLCMMTIHDDGSITNEVLLETKEGFLRDPDLSFDGTSLVFSMRKNDKNDDFHLYTMNLNERKPKQITFSATLPDGTLLPCADIEPCFTPDGGIIFQSTRCEQLIPCWKNKVSNLYKCQQDGAGMYRIGFDQVNTFYPKVLEDGRIIFTRWEYNDRDAGLTQSLFSMNCDGTSQLGYYGESQRYPVSLLHARGIPGSSQLMALASGHYDLHKGQLVLVDRRRGTNGDSGLEYVAGASPLGTQSSGRHWSNIEADQRWSKHHFPLMFGQFGPQYQAPFPLDEDHYLVSYLPEGSPVHKGPFEPGFGIYYMTADGNRELLAFDPTVSCSQVIPVTSQPCPTTRHSSVNHHLSFGQFFIQDVYLGQGMPNVPRGTIKKLRVVALEYRPCLIGGEGRLETQRNSHYAKYTDTEGSSAHILVSINGTWDVKHVLGEVNIEEDGSCFFEVPANNAVYFQMLDDKGRAVQTMRSWTMVLPGELASCIGCHEDKNEVGVAIHNSRAMASCKPIQKLQPIPGTSPHPLLEKLYLSQKKGTGLLDSPDLYLGVNQMRNLNNTTSEGFSFVQNIQPILDRHCISCHTGDLNHPDKTKNSQLSLLGKDVPYPKIEWLRNFSQSYLALINKGNQTDLLNWFSGVTVPELLPPYTLGSTKSKIMDYLEQKHYNVKLNDTEKRLFACWIDLGVPFCGSYYERNLWNDTMKKTYNYHQTKRRIYAEMEINGLKKISVVKP